jgi:hypothetical protein
MIIYRGFHDSNLMIFDEDLQNIRFIFVLNIQNHLFQINQHSSGPSQLQVGLINLRNLSELCDLR